MKWTRVEPAPRYGRDKIKNLTNEPSTSTKNRCFKNSDLHAGLNRVESLRTMKSIFLQDINKLDTFGA